MAMDKGGAPRQQLIDERVEEIRAVEREMLKFNMQMMRRSVDAAERMALGCPDCSKLAMAYMAWSTLSGLPGLSREDEESYTRKRAEQLGGMAITSAATGRPEVFTEFMSTIDAIRRTIEEDGKKLGERWYRLRGEMARPPPSEPPSWVGEVLSQ